MSPVKSSDIDVIEAGTGPLVVLVHSSVSGARQWRRLMAALSPSFHVKAVNLYGYGLTPAWPAARPQTLADQAALIAAVVPEGVIDLALVGHSFGAAIAMRAAADLGARCRKLVLLEPNPFYLLREHGRAEAFAEIAGLRDLVQASAARDDWILAAERFADYWGGPGTWAATARDRRVAFAEAMRPNAHEWDAVMNEATPLAGWAALLPSRTMIVYDEHTVRPIREIVELMRGAAPWQFQTLPAGGHMAPLTHPDLVNPVIAEFLQD